jgi:hypothetical protein
MHEVGGPAGGGPAGGGPASGGPADGDPRIALTAAGDDLQGRIRASLAAGTGELIAPFDPRDVETTIRTLTALTERARVLHGAE